jgi:hypothetical protein
MARSSTSGQGRPKGSPNKATADVKALASVYTKAAITALARLAGLVDEGEGIAESEQAQVSALKELLDRAHGKPAQTVLGDSDNPISISIDNTELTRAMAFILTKQAKQD